MRQRPELIGRDGRLALVLVGDSRCGVGTDWATRDAGRALTGGTSGRQVMKYYSDPNAMKIFSKITSLLGLPDDIAKAGTRHRPAPPNHTTY